MKQLWHNLMAKSKKPHYIPRLADLLTYCTEIGALSDVGCSRSNNQDNIGLIRFTDQRNILAIVADGMGGHQGGEVASQMAVETVQQHFAKHVAASGCSAALMEGIQAANKAVYQAAQQSKNLLGMGTTLVALAIRAGYAHYAHIGDSRLYLLRNGECVPLTEDHTLVVAMLNAGLLSPEAAINHPDNHIITRAIGTNNALKTDRSPTPLRLKIGDQFLLCSDGLSDVVNVAEINQIITSHSAQIACKQLVDLANSRGGFDNISVIVIHIMADAMANNALAITRA